MDDSREFDPYHEWLEIPPEDQPPTHYRLLGLEDFEEDMDVIDAASKKRTAFLHQIASGPNRKAVQRLLSEVATARRTLLSEKAKAAYDQDLQSPPEPELAEPLFQVDQAPANPSHTQSHGAKSQAAKPHGSRTVGRRKKSWLDDWRIHAVSASCLLAVAVAAVVIRRMRDTGRRASDVNAMETAARANSMRSAASAKGGRSLIQPRANENVGRAPTTSNQQAAKPHQVQPSHQAQSPRRTLADRRSQTRQEAGSTHPGPGR
jgi:hypothetical protein